MFRISSWTSGLINPTTKLMMLMTIETIDIIKTNRQICVNHIKSTMQSNNKARCIMMMKKGIFRAIKTIAITLNNRRFGDYLKMKINMDLLQRHRPNSKNYDIDIY